MKRKQAVTMALAATLAAAPTGAQAMPIKADSISSFKPTHAVVPERLRRIRQRRWLSRKEERRARIKMHRLFERAKSRLGFPYAWGGSGPTYFDCSGFTRWVLTKFGYNLPHSARSQYYDGELIHVSKVQEGRLLFFSYGRSGPGVIDHVELAIGGGRSIGASNTVEDVDIDPIDWDNLVGVGALRGW